MLAEYFRQCWPWRQQQRIDLRLRQFALAGERHLPQQPPAARQCQRFTIGPKVLAQGLGQGSAAVFTQGKQPAVAEHQQGAQRGAVFIDHAQACFRNPWVGAQGVFQ